MAISEFWPWLALAAFGAYHGANPAMGWLFAVALGLQEGSRKKVLLAFPPIALGHALSVGAVIAIVLAAGIVVPLDWLRWAGGAALVGYGLYKLWRNSHPRWVGMRVGFRDLVAWSFLMASAHGAGLMLLPLLFNLPGWEDAPPPGVYVRELPHSEYMFIGAAPSAETIIAQATAIGIHTVAMFGVMTAIAVIVYERLGLRLLRRSWVNLDRIWAATLILAGVATLLIGGY